MKKIQRLYEDKKIEAQSMEDFIMDVVMDEPKSTPIDDMVVEAGLGYWTNIGYNGGKEVKLYVRLNDDVDFDKVQEIIDFVNEAEKYKM